MKVRYYDVKATLMGESHRFRCSAVKGTIMYDSYAAEEATIIDDSEAKYE